MFEVCVQDRFLARHHLQLPDGSYETPHEHDWCVRLTYTGDLLDKNGWLVDFELVKARLHELLETLRGSDLNRLPAFLGRNPTAENVALYLAEQMVLALPGVSGLHCVEVEEQAGCLARYFPVSSVCPR
jgi:6-pyruvoyltetrahydropterin/6-carboxytetrahydropterin synthase